MQYWYEKKGEKIGPLEEFEFRDLIRENEITPDTLVWHKELEGWQEAGKVPSLRREFLDEDTEPACRVTTDESSERERPEVRAPFLAIRRFGARWFDLILYQVLLVLIFRLAGQPMVPTNPEDATIWRLLLQIFPLAIIEGAFLNGKGASPGKMLLGLKVTTPEGRFLSVGAGLIRSLRVYILGMGMMIPWLTFFGHLIAFWMGSKRGFTLWDWTRRYQVQGSKIGLGRLVVFLFLLLGLMGLLSAIAWPEVRPLVEQAVKEAEAARR